MEQLALIGVLAKKIADGDMGAYAQYNELQNERAQRRASSKYLVAER